VNVWSGARWFAPGRQITSLRTALSNYEYLGGSMEELFGFTEFISPVSGKPSIYFDCRGAVDQPVPVYAAQDIEAPELALASVGELVLVWTTLLEDGIWFDTPGHERPGYEDLLPEHVVKLGVY
jgi:hypothetical protein